MKAYDKLANEEKELKKKIKAETIALHMHTKEVIENLSNDQVYKLLEAKWIKPVVDALNKMPRTIVSEFKKKVETLAKKYAVTLADLEDDIKSAENELCGMIDQLTGNEFDMKGLAELKHLLSGE